MPALSSTAPAPTGAFIALVEPHSVEFGTAESGADYICLRNATVRTEYEIVEMTVMAFGTAISEVQTQLKGSKAIALALRHSGHILKVVEPQTAPSRPILASGQQSADRPEGAK